MIKYVQVGLCIILALSSVQFAGFYLRDAWKQGNGIALYLSMFFLGIASASGWYVSYILYSPPNPIDDLWQTINLLLIVGGTLGHAYESIAKGRRSDDAETDQ